MNDGTEMDDGVSTDSEDQGGDILANLISATAKTAQTAIMAEKPQPAGATGAGTTGSPVARPSGGVPQNWFLYGAIGIGAVALLLWAVRK